MQNLSSNFSAKYSIPEHTLVKEFSSNLVEWSFLSGTITQSIYSYINIFSLPDLFSSSFFVHTLVLLLSSRFHFLYVFLKFYLLLQVFLQLVNVFEVITNDNRFSYYFPFPLQYFKKKFFLSRT